MKPILLLLLIVLTSVASAGIAAFFVASDAAEHASHAAGPEVESALSPVVDSAAIDQRFERLEQSIADLAVAVQRRAAESVAAEPRLGKLADSAPLAAAEPAEEKLDARSAYESLLFGELGWEEREQLWQELRASGEIDAVLAMFEEAAALDPNNPDLQVDLGRAYIAKLQDGGSNLEVGMLATKADTAFDAALALDEGHLEARRQKAVSLSFWPPVLGKQVEAAQEFELLIENQKQHPADESHALAYLWLGNLKLQMGDKAAAQGAWNDGLALFPEHAELLAQLSGTQD